MSLQQVTAWYKYAFDLAVVKLSNPVAAIQSCLQVQPEVLPATFQNPVNFTTMLVLAVFIVVTYANNLVCNIIGICYPAWYGYQLHQAEIPHEILLRQHKYWMLMGLLIILDDFFGAVLQVIPGYYYAKITLIYALVREDFALIDRAYDYVATAYVAAKAKLFI